MAKRSKSSREWLKEHFNDEFVKRAQQEGYRSRAVYKLKEIQEKDKIIRPGMRIVELGAAPGGWTQYAAECIKGQGRIIALDLLAIEPLPDVEIIQGDFTEQTVLDELSALLGENYFIDLVLSDMAPNTSGIRSADQAKSMYLTELAVDFARQYLKPGGHLLGKIFHGQGFDTLLKELRKDYRQVVIRKPKASRARSIETYVLAKGYKL